MVADALLVVGGIALLAVASDQLVVGAARVALALRVSPVLVGAVVLGFGTSAPEMLVSGLAAAQGDLELGLGNIVGSNVANLTLVLGAAAVIVPVRILGSTLRREAPLMVAALTLFALLAPAGLTTAEGLVLLAALVGALALVIGWGRSGGETELVVAVEEYVDDVPAPTGREAGRTVVALTGTLLGAQLLVGGATGIADALDLSGGFVGLTLVAVGTSLPELVTALAAARRREDDLVVGNVLGSNLFNALAVGALVGIVGSGPVAADRLLGVGLVSMVAVAAAAWGLMAARRTIDRHEGVALLVAYGAVVALIGPTG